MGKTKVWEREPYKSENIQILTIPFHKEVRDQKKGLCTWNIVNSDIDYEHAQLIAELYNWIEDDAKKDSLVDVLCNSFKTNEDVLDHENYLIYWSTSLAFFALCKLWCSKEAVDNLIVSKNPITIISPLYKLLLEEYNYFDTSELGKILFTLKKIDLSEESKYYDFIRELKNTLEDLIDLIITLRYENLKKKINHVNIEINNDKKAVNEFLKEFWFDRKYTITLNTIDKFIVDDDFDETVIPWWIISIFREFFKDFYIDLAKKIALYNWLEDIPRNPSSTEEIWHAVNYIWREFWLSWDEKTLLKWYTEITNNNWAHKLLSEKKYFRLTRNIWIEISLFMLSKFEEYEKNKRI